LGGARLKGVRDVEVEYAVGPDGASLAYEVFGSGPIDLVLATSRFPIDLMWDLPQLAVFLDRLGEMARVIAFDQRGSGASDPLPADVVGGAVERSAVECLAVMDAAGCDRASHLSLYGAATGVFLAATYPERVRSLILGHLRASYPELRGYSTEQRKKMARALATPRGLRSDNPRVAHDPNLQRWWGRAQRATSPEATARQMEWAAETDVEHLLGSVRAPTLVLHRRDNQRWDVETSRAAARLMPNARFVDVPGAELDMFLGDTTPVLNEIERFLVEPDVRETQDRVLATVLFTDIVASTEQLAAHGDVAWRKVLDDHDKIAASVVAEYQGQVVKQTGDGILATFDGPARAVRCATTLLDSAHGQGFTLRAGLHTGEIELRPSDVAGIAIHIASRIAALADADEILVTRTVVDLTAGSGLQFEPHGEHQLKGVPGTWPTFVASA
jgi:class 3 adenylate cyclase